MAKNRKKKNDDEGIGSFILEFVIMLAVLSGIYYCLFTFVFSNETVSGPSMQPTFENNDRLIAVRHFDLKRNDIVILKAPDEKNALYIKRVIGLPGDMVTSKNDKLYINGKHVSEPYLNNSLAKKATKGGQLYTNNFTLRRRVPKNSYFVMGDHRDVSKDSRYFGFVKRSAIIGEVKLRYWPLNQWRVF
ncbi:MULTISPECIES: signal peptidase I [Lactobacillus]|uniref:Signal peptidase I n=1 Tax=Lactobacillus xujianguonis TaxID=2495899 RepID=A0A437SXS5_9LACO|nr:MULTISPECIES: signal peptidase I [Lactobacillus]RVU71719.1 signal peptidase I [Lactobacillus xujianguonis]RVU77549.1 signal peptidase I [Lactobacillus xujianguonis]